VARLLLHVVNDAGVFLSHRLVFARAARLNGWTVHVATPDGPERERVLAEGFVHHVIGLSRRGRNPATDVRTLRDLTRLFRRIRPAVIDCATIKPVLYGGIAARLAGVPGVVQTITGLGHVFADTGPAAMMLRGLVRLGYLGALGHPNSRVICQHADDCARLAFALREDQVRLIPGSGVNPTRFHPSPEPEGVPMVLLASRMLWTKGIEEFVEAVRIVRRRGVLARFILAGDVDPGNPASIPTAVLDEWAARGDVEWRGPSRDMPALMRQSAVVVLPTFYGEGVPKVLVEAAASGRPVVATDWPGCREIVRNGENGLLVPARDAPALADAMIRLLEDRPLRERMGQHGRSLALGRFTEARVVSAVLRVYDELAPPAAEPVCSRTA
jgi:glycosyltransferase involved in cell wall biosynthesis